MQHFKKTKRNLKTKLIYSHRTEWWLRIKGAQTVIILIFRFLTPTMSLSPSPHFIFSITNSLMSYNQSRFSTVRNQFRLHSNFIFETLRNCIYFCHDCRIRTNHVRGIARIIVLEEFKIEHLISILKSPNKEIKRNTNQHCALINRK